MTFERDNEIWFTVILSEKVQGKDLGRKILDELKQVELILNGWVIDYNNDKKKNRLIYVSPLKFYEKYGFEIQTDNKLKLDKISAVKIKWDKRKTIKSSTSIILKNENQFSFFFYFFNSNCSYIFKW